MVLAHEREVDHYRWFWVDLGHERQIDGYTGFWNETEKLTIVDGFGMTKASSQL